MRRFRKNGGTVSGGYVSALLYFLCFAAVLLLLCCCSGSSSDIGADITPTGSEAPRPMTETAETVPEIRTDLVRTETETETEGTAESIMTEPVTTESAAAEAVTETAAAGIEIPRLAGKTLDEVYPILEGAGVTGTVEYEASEKPADTVLKVRFFGVIGEGVYLLTREPSVTLIVSDGSLKKPSVRHTNVSSADGTKRIYLTFDDGPGPLTPQFLDILAEYDIPATFFTVGTFVSAYPQLISRMHDEGHLIGCHSYTHEYKDLYASADSLLSELSLWEAAVVKATGTELGAKVFRFPGGSNMGLLSREDSAFFHQTLIGAGYHSFDWTCAANDRWLVGKPEEMSIEDYLKQCTVDTVSSLGSGTVTPFIYIMHDTCRESLNVLPWVLDYLIENGFTFGTLDELDGDWLFY